MACQAEGSIVVSKVREAKGFATDNCEDLVKSGVIDPTKVTRTALQNAASNAGLLLTTECVVVEKKEDKPAPAAPPGAGVGGCTNRPGDSWSGAPRARSPARFAFAGSVEDNE